MKKRLQKKLTKKNQESKIMQNEQKSFFEILIEWLTWQKAGVIITGIGVIVSIILYILGQRVDSIPEPIEIIKNDIKKDIEIIEKEFDPNEIATDDSIYKEFQLQSIQLATLWTTIEDTKPYKEQVDKGLPSLVNILSHDFARIEKYNSNMKNIADLWAKMRDAEISKGDSLFSIFSYSKLTDINNMIPLKHYISNNYHNNCMTHLKSAHESAKNQNDIYDEIKKAMQELDNMKKDTNYYKVDKELFDLIIEVNKMYKANR